MFVWKPQTNYGEQSFRKNYESNNIVVILCRQICSNGAISYLYQTSHNIFVTSLTMPLKLFEPNLFQQLGANSANASWQLS